MSVLSIPSFDDVLPGRFHMTTRALRFPGSLRAGGQTLATPTELWIAEASTVKLWGADAAAWAVFFDQLHGPAGRFYFGHVLYRTPRGPAGGAPTVKGAGQTGKTLLIEGADASITGWMLKGDFFAVDVPSGLRELKRLTADVDTDGAGEATLPFEPPWRESPANGAAVIVQNATAIMQLVDDDQGIAEGERPHGERFSFRAVEAVDLGD